MGGFAQEGWFWSGEFGDAGLQDPVVDAGEEHGVAQAGRGDLVTVGVRDPFDEAVLAEPAQIVGGLAGSDRAWPAAEVLGEQGAQVLVEEPAGGAAGR